MQKFVPMFMVLAATAAQAAPKADPQQFVGRYKPDAEMCDNGFKDAERIYVQLEESSWRGEEGEARPMVLSFHAYGEEEANGEEVLLGSGVRQYPGSDREVHGEVPQRWNTVIRDNVLKAYSTVSRPSVNYEYRQVTTITAFQYGLRWEQTQQAKGGEKKIERCRLIAY